MIFLSVSGRSRRETFDMTGWKVVYQYAYKDRAIYARDWLAAILAPVVRRVPLFIATRVERWLTW